MNSEKNSMNKEPEVSSSIPAKSRDEFFGGLVIFILVLCVLLTLGFFAFLGYRIYDQRSNKSLSIEEITIPKFEDTQESEQNEVAAEEKPPENIAVADVKQSVVSVLNGGGAKGSAGVLADILKKVGFSKVTAGNAVGDYSGVTVFYGEGQKSAAETVLGEVVKKYPKATAAPADPKNKETSVADIVIIIGK